MGGHTLGLLHDLHLATVLDNADPDGRGRIQVRLHSTGLEAWTPVVVPSAGQGYGVACLPRQDEVVVVAFLSADQPMVLGAVWSGAGAIPTDAAPIQDRYLLQTPGGHQVLLDDAGPSLKLQTPAGFHLTLDDAGMKVTVEKGSEKIEMDASGIKISAAGKVVVEATQVEVSAGMLKVNAGLSQFSGMITCDALQTQSVISSSYTPGAGNIW